MKKKATKKLTKSTNLILRNNSNAGRSFEEGKVVTFDEDFKKRPLRYSYWRGWFLYHINLFRALIFPSADKHHINQLKDDFLSDSNPETLKKLMDEDPWALIDPRINREIFLLIYKYKITLNKVGRARGKPYPIKLRKLITQDIEMFRELVDKRLEGKTVEVITKRGGVEARIWRYYIKPARMILNTFLYDEHSREDWKVVFECFEAMALVAGHDYPYSVLRLRDKNDDTILLTRNTPLFKDGVKIVRP